MNCIRYCILIESFIDMEKIKARKATKQELMMFHTEEYINKFTSLITVSNLFRIKAMSEDRGGEAGEETLVGVGSYKIACYAVGGCIAAVQAVHEGVVK